MQIGLPIRSSLILVFTVASSLFVPELRIFLVFTGMCCFLNIIDHCITHMARTLEGQNILLGPGQVGR